NRFLSSKKALLATGELTIRTFHDYKLTCKTLVEVFGWSQRVDALTPEDFERLRTHLAKTRGAVALGNEINKTKIILKYAADNRLIPLAIAYGQSFRRPSRKALRLERIKRGPKFFEAAEIKRMLAKASVPLKALILLGVNGAFGQSDLGQLKRSAINLETGWLSYARPKTGIERRCWLWPETREAIKAAMDQ